MLTALRRKLLRWFDNNRRPMPWRADRDPYRIWISEVMLQQTTVAAVVPFFERFLERFPTANDLAAAEERHVLLLWQGLGYYSRARNLHRAAKIIAAEHGGQFPQELETAAALPGIGRYTVGAILSQAFEVPLPIVEANTRRLYARLFARFDLDLKSSEGIAWLWQAAQELLPRKRIGDFNQALMELGATVCKPKPLCERCPLTGECAAFLTGLQDTALRLGEKAEFTAVEAVALAIEADGKYLLRERGPEGRWAGLWEFPYTELVQGEGEDAAVARLLKELKLKARIGPEFGTVRHGVTRFKIRLTGRLAQAKGPTCDSGGQRWLLPEDWASYPLSTPMRKLAELLRKPRRLSLF